MKRRSFIQKSSMMAVAVSTLGGIHWNGSHFVGDSPTTTDILGPFYRPGAPMRANIVPKGCTGIPMHLHGTISNENGKIPLKNAIVEIWQCDENAYYDNTSDDYVFRGAAKTGNNGKYAFKTIVPVPYKANPNDESSWRPAHIHMRVSVPKQQDLITQIYFKDDKHIKNDKWASRPEAVNRTLSIVKNSKGEHSVTFDVALKREYPLDNKVYEQIAGLYKMDDKSTLEFRKRDDLLFLKRNGQLMEGLRYIGNNTFEGGIGNPKATFELLKNQGSQVTVSFRGKTIKGEKYLKYN